MLEKSQKCMGINSACTIKVEYHEPVPAIKVPLILAPKQSCLYHVDSVLNSSVK